MPKTTLTLGQFESCLARADDDDEDAADVDELVRFATWALNHMDSEKLDEYFARDPDDDE